MEYISRVASITFSGEIKSCCCASSPVAPVHCPLPVAVLIVVEYTVGVLASVPELSKGHFRHSGVDVLLGVLAT